MRDKKTDLFDIAKGRKAVCFNICFNSFICVGSVERKMVYVCVCNVAFNNFFVQLVEEKKNEI